MRVALGAALALVPATASADYWSERYGMPMTLGGILVGVLAAAFMWFRARHEVRSYRESVTGFAFAAGAIAGSVATGLLSIR